MCAAATWTATWPRCARPLAKTAPPGQPPPGPPPGPAAPAHWPKQPWPVSRHLDRHLAPLRPLIGQNSPGRSAADAYLPVSLPLPVRPS
eukprot:6352975-Pyramimonas_sp.AAC.1